MSFKSIDSQLSLSANTTSIPHIIHQIWKSSDMNDYPLSPSCEAWRYSYKNWKYKIWYDIDILRLLQTDYPWLLEQYNSYGMNIQRADLARLIVVYHDGGLYVDLDGRPNYITFEKEYMDSFDSIFPRTSDEYLISNHFFLAKRHSPFLLFALKTSAIKSNLMIFLPYLRVFATTGPLFLTTAFREYIKRTSKMKAKPENIVILSSDTARKFVMHYAGRSWLTVDGWILNWINDLSYGWKMFFLLCILLLILSLICIMREFYCYYDRSRSSKCYVRKSYSNVTV